MVLERIKKILREFNDFTDEQLVPTATFVDLGLDSLDIVDLVMRIDDEFGTTITMDGSLKTLGDLIEFVNENKNED